MVHPIKAVGNKEELHNGKLLDISELKYVTVLEWIVMKTQRIEMPAYNLAHKFIGEATIT